MSLPRPRSDRMGSETSSITISNDFEMNNFHHNHNPVNNVNIWTPLPVMGGVHPGGGGSQPVGVSHPLNHHPHNAIVNGGSVAGSLRGDSPMVLQQLDQLSLVSDASGVNPSAGSTGNGHPNHVVSSTGNHVQQLPPGKSAMRYSTVGRPGRPLHHMNNPTLNGGPTGK